MRWFDAACARFRLLFARRAAESRMDEELGFHIDMEAERLIREAGLDASEARRRALIVFGGVENHKEALRSGRGFAWLGGTSLDFKLGLRMLAKYPGLTLVGVVGMAVGVAIGAVGFSAISAVVDATLPLDDGDRIVVIRNANVRDREDGRRTHLSAMAVWRNALHSVGEIAAYRVLERNLITRDGRSEPVHVAEMTASGFRIARVPPHLGRYFHADDERAAAPSVVVIGYDLWQSRFVGRPDVVGQTIQLGTAVHTIVGVMPRGFAFPINNRVWTPLQLTASDYEPGRAPGVEVFGRLAPGATLEQAQQQLTIIGQRLALADSATYDGLRPRVVPYARAFLDAPELIWVLHLLKVLIGMLLVVIGTNVAILVYARTANRAGEIAIRTALGASRGRVVAQLFTEALVLSIAAAGVGLIGARFALGQIDALLARMGGEDVPFWIHFGITPGVIAYVAGLAVVAAVIVGVAPALKVTRRDVLSGLQQLGLGGSGMRLGKMWTLMVVAQVTVAVVLLPMAILNVVGWTRAASVVPAFATKQFLTTTLFLDEPERQAPRLAAQRTVVGKIASIGATPSDGADYDRAYAVRFAARRAELAERLEAEPGVTGVVFASAFRGGEPDVRMEVDSGAAAANTRGTAPPSDRMVGVNHVDLGYFDAFDLPILSGRAFQTGDKSSSVAPVIVNRSFAQQMFGSRNPLGRRVRPVPRRGRAPSTAVSAEPWEEIVGVVADFPNAGDSLRLKPRLYRLLEPTDARPVTIAVQVRTATPATFATRLRELTVSADPMLRLGNIQTLDQNLRDQMAAGRFAALALTLVTLSTVLLSAAGIHALISFTITRRRREIGIRSALGAGQRRVLMSVLSTSAAQIGAGISVGVVIVGLVISSGNGWTISVGQIMSLVGIAALMTVVGLLAAIGPARRALAIQPTEALRAE